MIKPATDDRAFLAFAGLVLLCAFGGLALGAAISPDACRSFSARNPVFAMTMLIQAGIIAQSWPRARNVRLMRSLAARAGTLLLLILAAAILQPSLYCAVEPGLGFYAAIGGVVALWVAVLLFAHLFFARYAARLRQASAAGEEGLQA